MANDMTTNQPCFFCGGTIVDDSLVYVRFDKIGAAPTIQHVEHGPIGPRFRHDEFSHTSRCNTGGCRD